MSRFYPLLILAFCSIFLLTVDHSVMRESDQASFILGAWEIVNSKSLDGLPTYYMGDKSFVTYLFLSACYAIHNDGLFPANAEALVRHGNLAQVFLFLSALGCFLWSVKKWSFSRFVLLLTCFTAPALLFSVPYVSSAVVSVSFGLLLWSVLSRGYERGRWLGNGCVFVLAFLMVGARTDSVLVLPLVSLILWKETKGIAFFRIGLIGGGALLAILAGELLGGNEGALLSSPMIRPKIVAAYFLFGMGPAVVTFAYVLMLVARNHSEKWFGKGFLIAVLVLPFVFYSFFLFSPRYWILGLFGLLIVVSRDFLLSHVEAKVSRVVMVGFLAVSFAFWLCGLNVNQGLQALRLGRVPTLYPTADGKWPMGGFYHFHQRLAHVSSDPIDHNQRFWKMWRSVLGEDSSHENYSVNSSLASYFKLVNQTRYQGEGSQQIAPSRVLFDSRSVLRGNPNDGGSAIEVPPENLSLKGSEQGYHVFEYDSGHSVHTKEALEIDWVKKLSKGGMGYYVIPYAILKQRRERLKGHYLISFPANTFQDEKNPLPDSVNLQKKMKVIGEFDMASLSPEETYYVSEYPFIFDISKL